MIFKQHMEYIGGFDVLLANIPEFEKLTASTLADIVVKLRNDFPNIMLLATGGINEKNAAEYARTGIDGIVTTNLYNAKPIDIGVDITPL